MPLCIAAVALLGWGLAGLPLSAALLLGAALAPTDPVLAGDLQVDGPGKGDTHGVRFTLTAEAGLNDGLAFPFVYLAIAVASLGLADPSWLGSWLLRDGLYRIAAGVAVGAGVGWLLARLVYRAPHDKPVASTGLACVALCVFLIAYGAAELAGGYGFIAAFVSAVVLRGAAHDHDYNGVLFDVRRGGRARGDGAGPLPPGRGGAPGPAAPHLGRRRGRARPGARRPPPGRLARPGRARLGPARPAGRRLLRHPRDRLAVLPGLRAGQRGLRPTTRSSGRSWWRRSSCPRPCTA